MRREHIGVSFRLTLQSVIYNSQKRHDLDALQTKRRWFRRSAAYEEIFDYSFMDYFYAFVLPYYLERDPCITGPDRMLELNDGVHRRCDLLPCLLTSAPGIATHQYKNHRFPPEITMLCDLKGTGKGNVLCAR